MPSNSCELHVGRLIEIRVDAGYGSVASVDEMIGWIRDAIALVPSTSKVVIAADWRGCRLMSTEASERAVQMMTNNNPRVERSAVLVSRTSPTAVLQFLRVLRESGHADRRLFYETAEMATWLNEILGRSEQKQLAAFLRVPFPSTAPPSR